VIVTDEKISVSLDRKALLVLFPQNRQHSRTVTNKEQLTAIRRC